MTESEVDYAPIAEILIDIFGDYKFHNEHSGQISFSCPVCSYDIKGLDVLDGKGNLEVNYIQGVYKCWACSETHDTRGRLRYLVKKYASPRQFKKFELLIPDIPGEIEKKHYKRVRLPHEYVSFKDASAGLKITPIYKTAYNYLKKRNITDQMIEKFQIGFCYEGKYKNRIIIPSFDSDDIINYFIARSYETNPYKKYDNPEAEKQIIIFNESLINWDEPIQLVEGAFDSIFLPNAIPMLGKVLSDHLFAILYERAVKITIILDGDAYKNALILYDKLNGGRLFGKIWMTKLPEDKDIADLKGDLTEYPPFQLD